MTGVTVFLVLLFSLVVVKNNDEDDASGEELDDNDSNEDDKNQCHCPKLFKGGSRSSADYRQRCSEDICQKISDCFQELHECFQEVNDCCQKILECCQKENWWQKIRNRCQQLCASTASPTVTASISSGSTPGSKSSTSTDSTITSHMAATWTSSGSTSNSESSKSAEPIASSTESSTGDSSVVVAVLSCLVVLFVVLVAVAVFFLCRRKRRADGVRKENNQSCLSAAINLEQRQNSLDNKRTNIGNASTGAANSPDNDNNDDYTYIDGPAINKGVVRLHQDKTATTTGEHALTDLSVSGLQPDLSSTYRLAQAVDNDVPDSQTPDYFILEKDAGPGAEPTQYFILEERSEKDSVADTETLHYFILEDRREGDDKKSIPEVTSSESGGDYFVLEKDGGQESDCVARDEASRGPSKDAEYSRLDPNRQESEYITLNPTAPQSPSKGDTDNPYSLASCPK